MAQDKKVKITGAVEIDQGQANAELNKLNQELAEFKTGMADIKTGITLILRSLASMASDMGLASEATEAAAAAAKDQSAELEKTADAAHDLGSETAKVTDETEKLSGKTEVLRGLWQRIGHKAIDGIVSAIRGLIGYFGSLVSTASEVDAIFDKMSARGVSGVNEMRVAVVELAGAIGEDLLQVAQSVNLAESLGAGSDAVEVARAAWENFRVTGMDVSRQLEISSRLSRAFNMEIGEQADLIRQVGIAAQTARISQDALWNGLSSIGPKIKQLGGTYKDMIATVNAALAQGIKVEEEGPQGMNELLDSLISSTGDFGSKLVEFGVIATQSSAKWQQLKTDVDAQASAFAALNDQVKEYQKEATAIGLLADETEQLMNAYSALAKRKEEGERLNSRERRTLRDYERALADSNAELSAYDDSIGLVQDRQFKMMSTYDQLAVRLQAAKQAQTDLNFEMRKMQTTVEETAEPLQSMQTNLAALSTTVDGEIKASLQSMVGNEGLGGLLTKLAETPEAMKGLPAAAQTLVAAIGPAMAAVNASVTPEVAAISGQFNALEVAGTNAFARLKTSIATIATTLMTPVAEALNGISQLVLDSLNNSGVLAAITEWTTKIAATIMADIEAVTTGDVTLGELLRGWFESALIKIQELWQTHIQPLFSSLMQEVDAQMPALQSFLEDAFTVLGKAALNAFGNAVGNLLDNVGGGAMDWALNQTGAGDGTAQLGTRARVLDATGGRPVSSTNNFNIYGATNPDDVASRVSRTIAQQERLGMTGDRRLR